MGVCGEFGVSWSDLTIGWHKTNFEEVGAFRGFDLARMGFLGFGCFAGLLCFLSVCGIWWFGVWGLWLVI